MIKVKPFKYVSLEFSGRCFEFKFSDSLLSVAQNENNETRTCAVHFFYLESLQMGG
jgi:hypothetical protein